MAEEVFSWDRSVTEMSHTVATQDASGQENGTLYNFPMFSDPSFQSSEGQSLLPEISESDLITLSQALLPLTPPLPSYPFLNTEQPVTSSREPSADLSSYLPAQSINRVLSMYATGSLTPPVSPAPMVIATNLAAQQVRVITPSEVLPTGEKPVNRRHYKQKFPCADCGKTYTQRRTRDLHMLVHTGERPFVCDRCGASFNRPGTLKVHRITEVCLRKQRRAFDQRSSGKAGRAWANRTSVTDAKF